MTPGNGNAGSGIGPERSADASVIVVPSDAPSGFTAPLPDFDFTPPADQSVAYQINAAHSGRQPKDSLRPPLRQRWFHAFDGAISYPIIADGRIIVVSQTRGNVDPTIYAFDAKSGSPLWQAGPYGGYIKGQEVNLAYDRGAVFAATEDGELIALDAATGKERWSEHLDGFYGFTSMPVAAGGAVFVTGPNSLFAIDENTGLPVYESKNSMGGTPTLGSGRIFLSAGCHETQGLDAKTGTEIWHFKTDCFGGGGITDTFFEGRVFVEDDFDPFFVLDAATGGKVSEAPTSFYNPCFDQGLAFFTDVAKLTAVDLASSAARWTYTAPSGFFFFGPSIVVAGMVAALDESGGLALLDGASGNVLWSGHVNDPDPVWNNPSPAPQRGLGAGEGVIVIPYQTGLYVYEHAEN
jgi:outer membrane protein assembly factor BamB